MSCASRRRGFVIPRATQEALTFFQGQQRSGILTEGVSINLSQGDPAFVTPEHIRRRAQKAIDEGHTHYERNRDLRAAIADKLARENHITVDPDRGVLVTPGAHAALYQVMRAYLCPGDEVLMGDPGSYYFANTVVNGGHPVPIPLRPERGFRLDPDEVAARITPKTKILALTNPDAPTGAVHRPEDIEALAELAQRHDLLVISDEVYEYINYGKVPHTSIAAFPQMAERTLTVNGLSKGWAMTGWRVGYVAGDSALVAPVAAIHHLNLISINSIAQWAALAALSGPQDFIETARTHYREQMELLMALLSEIPGVHATFPDGTYYAWTRISDRAVDDAAFARYLVTAKGVRVLPGSDFGWEGRGYLRLSCALPRDQMKEGVKRLADGLDDFEPPKW